MDYDPQMRRQMYLEEIENKDLEYKTRAEWAQTLAEHEKTKFYNISLIELYRKCCVAIINIIDDFISGKNIRDCLKGRMIYVGIILLVFAIILIFIYGTS